MIAVLGATGYTGRLVLRQARADGVALRLVGRRREALEEVAREGDEVVVADARDEPALRRAFDGADVVLSLAGPFLELGPAPVSAALAAGAHYADSSGEQPWVRLLQERYDAAARSAGGVVLPCFGFDYVPGDLAARLAAEGLEPLDEVIAAYAVAGAASSRGTRRTIGRVLGQPLVAYEDGRLVPSRFGATQRRVRFPFGERTAIEWSGTEPLTVPRHTQVRNVRSYVVAPRPAARLARLASLAAPFARLSARVGRLGPSEEARSRSRFAVVAEARGPAGERSVTLTGHDPYGLTALLLVRAARLLQNGAALGAGVLAPAEAFEVRALLAEVEPLLSVRSAS